MRTPAYRLKLQVIMQDTVYRGRYGYQRVFLAMLRVWGCETRGLLLVAQVFESERAWLARAMKCEGGHISHRLIAGDASPRKFYRITRQNAEPLSPTFVLMVSPATENNDRFILVQGLLADGGVRAPNLLRADLQLGYFLLEDLGDITFWSAIQSDESDAWYRRALTTLGRLQALDSAAPALPLYDDAELQRELNICDEWFFAKVLSLTSDAVSKDVFTQFSQRLLVDAASQPKGLVHRDYHSRNLMALGSEDLAVIDFQDAITGPITYDLVSLLKDVYVVWPREQQLKWLEYYWALKVDEGTLSASSKADFVRWFDLMGLQRHVKILGVFSRLWLRDNKPSYMHDIPVVIDYIREACAMYGEQFIEIRRFWDWFEESVLPVVKQAEWYRQE